MAAAKKDIKEIDYVSKEANLTSQIESERQAAKRWWDEYGYCYLENGKLEDFTYDNRTQALKCSSCRRCFGCARSCEKNDLRLLQRLTACESPSINQHYKAYLARCGLLHAVKHDSMEMIRWVHVYCPATHVLEAMKEAVSLGNLRVMTWIADNYEEIQWGTSYGEAAAQNQDLKALEWIKARRPEFLSTAMRTAASCSHFEIVKWLHANVQNEDYGIEEAIESGHLEIIKYLCKHDEYTLDNWYDRITETAAGGHLDVIQWLHANNLSSRSEQEEEREAKAPRPRLSFEQRGFFLSASCPVAFCKLGHCRRSDGHVIHLKSGMRINLTRMGSVY
ncbi:hypothetical protein FI667_g14726, partial [Globisporangium splendens]